MPYYGMGAVDDCNKVAVPAADKVKRVDLESTGCKLLTEDAKNAIYCCGSKLAEQGSVELNNMVPTEVKDVKVLESMMPQIQLQFGNRCQVVGQQNGLMTLRCDAEAAAAAANLQLPATAAPEPTAENIVFTEQTFPVEQESLLTRVSNWVKDHPLLTVGGIAVGIGGAYMLRGQGRGRRSRSIR